MMKPIDVMNEYVAFVAAIHIVKDATTRDQALRNMMLLQLLHSLESIGKTLTSIDQKLGSIDTKVPGDSEVTAIFKNYKIQS